MLSIRPAAVGTSVLLVLLLASGCASQASRVASSGANASTGQASSSPASSAAVRSPTPTVTSSPVPAASVPQPMGDAVALGACQTYEKGLGAHALTVVAGFSTTVGAAYRYQNQVSEATGGGMPPPADVQGPNYTSTAPTVLCVADGTIDGPGSPGVYSREVGMLSGDGTFQALVLSDAKDVPLQRP